MDAVSPHFTWEILFFRHLEPEPREKAGCLGQRKHCGSAQTLGIGQQLAHDLAANTIAPMVRPHDERADFGQVRAEHDEGSAT